MSSLSGHRAGLYNENFLSESESDANSVLMELDKGLRSPKLGEKIESIVRFPRLFERYPFPILINSSFLKLSEFFWNGTNLLRYWVLRVCQQSEHHLDKILNIDAFVKRIYLVTHSNDPMARAITLRVFGAICRVIPEKQQVHHAIRRALDSHDTVEVEAAIYASAQFASQSRTFSISMCTKIGDMIESLQVPLPMKLLLIPVLRHMHHDANTASLVKTLCLDLLRKYPAQDFVVAILASLTDLSAHTFAGIPEHIKFLLDFLDDPRDAVRCQALMSLTKLADKQCVHAWPKAATSELIVKVEKFENPREAYLVLMLLLKLCDFSLACNVLLNEELPTVVKFCQGCVAMSDLTTASEAIRLFAALAHYSNGEPKVMLRIMHVVNLDMEGLLLCTVGEAKHARNLRKILTSAVRIASVDEKFGIAFIHMITNLLTDEVEYPPGNVEIMCDTLAALCSHFQLLKFAPPPVDEPMNGDNVKHPNVSNVLGLIVCKLNSIMEKGPSPQQLHTVETLAATVLQTMMGCFMPTEVLKCFERCCERTNLWTQYRIARSAFRYGQHFLGTHIISKILRNAFVDKLYFFLMGLKQMGQAECLLNYGVAYDVMQENYAQCEPSLLAAADDTAEIRGLPLMQRLDAAINLYWQALTSVRASSSPVQSFAFQAEYIKLRAQFLQALHNAVTVKNAQIIVPPPAIANSLAQNSRDYLQKYGHVTNQLRKLVKTCGSCEEAFSRLYKSAFDADPLTLEFLEITEYQCALFAHIVETICYATPSDPPTFSTIGSCPETRYFASCIRRMEQMMKNIPAEPANAKSISNRHLEVVIAEIEIITKAPLCLPRFFFQVLQSTQIKLSVHPQPRIPGEPVIVQSGSNLVIKVEGVIHYSGKKRSFFRSVDSVQLSLTSQLLTPRPPGEMQKSTNDTSTLVQSVKPQRDFIAGSFLLPISSGGQWQVTLETHVMDESGIIWCTGPKSSMLVRVLDDQTKAAAPSVQTGQTRRF